MSVIFFERFNMLGEREIAVAVARQLQERGYTALFVGGCVRDKVLGLSPSDYDVSTTAPLAVVKELITPMAEGIPKAGSSYPVAKFVINGFHIDVTSMKNGSLVDDTNRRDFTMNAMYEDPLTGEIFDLLHGRRDMELGVLRGIGNVVSHMKDDIRRMVRAPRFAAVFGYQIHADVWSASKQCAHLVRDINQEWLANEMKTMATGAHLQMAWDFLAWTGVVDHIPAGWVRDCFEGRVSRTSVPQTSDVPLAVFGSLFRRLCSGNTIFMELSPEPSFGRRGQAYARR